jgi:ribosomal protein S6E (S10)
LRKPPSPLFGGWQKRRLIDGFGMTRDWLQGRVRVLIARGRRGRKRKGEREKKTLKLTWIAYEGVLRIR